MANEDAEPPRLVRPYITPPADDPTSPHDPAGAPAAAGGAHRVPARQAAPHRPGATRAGPAANLVAPGDTPAGGARTGPGGDPAGRAWRRVILIVVAAVAVVAALVAVAVLAGRDRRDPAAAPSALPLPSAPPDAGEPSPAASTPGASSGPAASSAARSPSRAGTPRRSATASAAASGTPAAANPDGANLALGRPATASSVEGEAYAPRFAVDGDPRTRWSSAFNDPQWIGVDLGRLWLLTQVTLRWEAAYGVEYDVAVSADGTTWRTVFRTAEGAGGVRDVRFAAAPARFVRMTGTRRAGQYGYSLFELEAR